MFSDVPYWRPPKARSVWSFSWSLMVSKSVCSEVPVKPTTRNLQANEFRPQSIGSCVFDGRGPHDRRSSHRIACDGPTGIQQRETGVKQGYC